MEQPAEIPREWKGLPVDKWRQPVLLLGGTDTGKSTFGRWLYRELLARGNKAAYLDADPGQNDLGPPATIALGTPAGMARSFPPMGGRWLYFIGNNTPRGQMLRLLTGIDRLRQVAFRQQCKPLVVNSSGLIAAQDGGVAIKWALVDLLRPCVVVALQRDGELEPILKPLRPLAGVTVVDLPVAAEVVRRSTGERQRLRAEAYRRVFAAAGRQPVAYGRLALFPGPQFVPGQLVALEEKSGLTVALGLVEKVQPENQIVWLRTGWDGKMPVAALRLGGLRLHRETYQDSPLG